MANEPIFWIDEKACLKGGELGGAYLDSIGKSDLASLDPHEWATFCVKVTGGAFLAAIGDVHGDQIPF